MKLTKIFGKHHKTDGAAGDRPTGSVGSSLRDIVRLADAKMRSGGIRPSYNGAFAGHPGFEIETSGEAQKALHQPSGIVSVVDGRRFEAWIPIADPAETANLVSDLISELARTPFRLMPKQGRPNAYLGQVYAPGTIFHYTAAVADIKYPDANGRSIDGSYALLEIAVVHPGDMMSNS